MEPSLSDAANGFALLAGDGAKLALKAGVPVPGGVKLHWRVPDLAAAVERLTAAGVAVGPLKASAEGYTRAAVTDPDGYAVVVFAWDGRNPGERGRQPPEFRVRNRRPAC